MPKHEHLAPAETCAHDIDFCKQCDVCFCKKCEKEWKFHSVNVRDLADQLGPQKFPREPYHRGLWLGNPNIVLCQHTDARGINATVEPGPYKIREVGTATK